MIFCLCLGLSSLTFLPHLPISSHIPHLFSPSCSSSLLVSQPVFKLPDQCQIVFTACMTLHHSFLDWHLGFNSSLLWPRLLVPALTFCLSTTIIMPVLSELCPPHWLSARFWNCFCMNHKSRTPFHGIVILFKASQE